MDTGQSDPSARESAASVRTTQCCPELHSVGWRPNHNNVVGSLTSNKAAECGGGGGKSAHPAVRDRA